jgi:flavin-dependent thymidylate synthase
VSIRIRHDFDVELVEVAGSDELICKAARVSTLGAASIDSSESEGLLRFLMRNRHGSPFEHGFMTFRISAPIVVWREFMRHRIGFSYNEQSGRYMELEPVFYMPPVNRALSQVGKAGHYEFVPGTEMQYLAMREALSTSYQVSWDAYQTQLRMEIAKEVARLCLPVAVYSTAYVTCNPRSLMSFLSLRTKNEVSIFPSYPQWEISRVADQMERIFADEFPKTAKLFTECGRVSP